MLKLTIGAVAIIGLSTSATYAQGLDGFYAGAGVASISAEDSESNEGFTSTNINILAGYQISPYFAVEGEGSFVVSEDSITIEDTTVDVGLAHFGIFAKANFLPSSEAFVPFARVGYVRGTVEASAVGLSISDDDETFAFGLGAEYNLNSQTSLRLDVVRADFETDDVTTESTFVSLNTVVRF